MKRIAFLLAAVLFSAASLYADDMGKETEMSGVLCNAKCVVQNASHAACNQSCAEKTGDVVLVDDQGRIFKIANQDKVALHAGKKVKVKCHAVKSKEDTMYIDNLYLGG
jgi:pectin methylesterase-like acyl-CoA thioesterase